VLVNVNFVSAKAEPAWKRVIARTEINDRCRIFFDDKCGTIDGDK
jgi:hypothetical protein